jgi:hypothetical protein
MLVRRNAERCALNDEAVNRQYPGGPGGRRNRVSATRAIACPMCLTANDCFRITTLSLRCPRTPRLRLTRELHQSVPPLDP